MLHAIEFGSDITGRWEFDHDDKRHLILRVRARKLTRGIAGLIRCHGVSEDVQVTCVPLPGVIPAPRDHREHLRPAPAPVPCTTVTPRDADANLLSTVIRRLLAEGG
ncbi:hypothetical protein [Amycolatopsis sp. NPDC051716]|uniref:hypothetical protein n=1 Tax=Amycolatopsis sp. NPDC051716 TaxID=3155804 RepID=UPI003430B370